MALGVGYWRVSQSNEQLRLAKAETDRRLDQTLQAVQDYYTGVSQDVLLGKEEFQGLRARLLERPQKFYEQMTRELETANDERGQSLVGEGGWNWPGSCTRWDGTKKLGGKSNRPSPPTSN